MDRDRVIRALQAHQRELRAVGVASVSLFGSTARGETAPGDVDLAVRLNENFSRGGFDYFGRLEDLERYLCKLLGCKVDVSRNRFVNPGSRKRSTGAALLPSDNSARNLPMQP